jgi:uncharacterized protein
VTHTRPVSVGPRLVGVRANRLNAVLAGNKDLIAEMMPADMAVGYRRGASFDFQDFDGQFRDSQDDIIDSGNARWDEKAYNTLIVLQATTLCNINCSYCYLPDRAQNTRMSQDVLRATFDSVLASSLVSDPVMFLWHLGEPLAASPGFYEEAFALAARTARRYGRRVRHAFQTNATLVNNTWIELIKRHDVLVGISVDGPAFIHDRARITRRGSGTHASVMRGVARLQGAGLRFGAISVLTDFTLDYPDEFYDFFVSSGIRNVAFNIDEIEGVHRHSSLASAGSVDRYRDFLTRVLKRAEYHHGAVKIREVWANMSVLAFGAVEPSNSTNKALAILTVDHLGNMSSFSPELVAARTAGVRKFTMGNVLTDSLEEMLENPVFRDVRCEIAAGVQLCRDTCDYWSFCGGGSPSNKFFEHGRFDVSETRNCHVHKKATVDALMNYLELRTDIDTFDERVDAEKANLSNEFHSAMGSFGAFLKPLTLGSVRIAARDGSSCLPGRKPAAYGVAAISMVRAAAGGAQAAGCWGFVKPSALSSSIR